MTTELANSCLAVIKLVECLQHNMIRNSDNKTPILGAKPIRNKVFWFPLLLVIMNIFTPTPVFTPTTVTKHTAGSVLRPDCKSALSPGTDLTGRSLWVKNSFHRILDKFKKKKYQNSVFTLNIHILYPLPYTSLQQVHFTTYECV